MEAHLTAIDNDFTTLQDLFSVGHLWFLFAVFSALFRLKFLCHANPMYPINLAVAKKPDPPKEEVKTKKRNKKDPNAPKKPMPPFFCY